MRAQDFAESVVARCIAEPNLRAIEACCELARDARRSRDFDIGHIAEVVRRTGGARLLVVAAAFGILPLQSHRGGWVAVGADAGAGVGVLPTADDEAVCAFALWRAMGNSISRPMRVPKSAWGPGGYVAPYANRLQ